MYRDGKPLGECCYLGYEKNDHRGISGIIKLLAEEMVGCIWLVARMKAANLTTQHPGQPEVLESAS